MNSTPKQNTQNECALHQYSIFTFLTSHSSFSLHDANSMAVDLGFAELYTMPCASMAVDLGFAELYTMPCASMALATFMKPATLAPFT